MYRAVSPVTSPEHRAALVELLGVVARSGLLTPGSRLRQVELKADRPVNEYGLPGTVLTFGARRLLVLSADADDREVKGLEYAPDGVFGALDGYAITRERTLDTGIATPDVIAEFTRLLAANGPIAWDPERVAALSDAAGISLAEATMVLAGLPSRPGTSRSRSGCASCCASTAPRQPRPRTGCARAASPRPRGCWPRCCPPTWPRCGRSRPRRSPSSPPPGRGRYGARMPVTDDLIVLAHRAGIARGMSASELLHGLANAETCRWLDGGVDDIDDDDVLVSVVRALPWLVYRLPADDPIRDGLSAVLERVRHRLADPDMLVDVGYLDEKKVATLTKALGVPVISDERGIDAGAVFFPPDSGWRKTQVRPSRLTGADDPVLGMLIARMDDAHGGPIAAIRVLLGDQLSEWVTYKVPPEAVGAEHDPSRCAPALVAEIAQARGLGPDAATIYLQLLALPDPTDRQIAAWTGWKPARLKAARAELAATDLVVDAKRTRAGRTLFLPGGWLALRAPHLPLERWKLPLLVGGAGAIDGIGMVIPIAPVPRLFELAWARVAGGDAPRFDDLVTGRQR